MEHSPSDPKINGSSQLLTVPIVVSLFETLHLTCLKRLCAMDEHFLDVKQFEFPMEVGTIDMTIYWPSGKCFLMIQLKKVP